MEHHEDEIDLGALQLEELERLRREVDCLQRQVAELQVPRNAFQWRMRGVLGQRLGRKQAQLTLLRNGGPGNEAALRAG